MTIIWVDCCPTSFMIGASWESGRYGKLLFYAVLVSGHINCAHCAMGGCPLALRSFHSNPLRDIVVLLKCIAGWPQSE